MLAQTLNDRLGLDAGACAAFAEQVMANNPTGRHPRDRPALSGRQTGTGLPAHAPNSRPALTAPTAAVGMTVFTGPEYVPDNGFLVGAKHGGHPVIGAPSKATPGVCFREGARDPRRPGTPACTFIRGTRGSFGPPGRASVPFPWHFPSRKSHPGFRPVASRQVSVLCHGRFSSRHRQTAPIAGD